MNIVFLTWKDIKHPAKWWAEIVLYNYMIRLVKLWHNITWFASDFKWSKCQEEVIEWIKIIRRYSIYSIYFLAWIWYKKFIKHNKVDIVIDEAWWIPLLSPLFIRNKPIIFFIHHIGDKEWDYKFPFPLNKIGKFIYILFFKLYRRYPTITVSDSTRDELVSLWFHEDNISVISNVLDMKPIKKVIQEEKENWVVYVGRLMPMKRVEDAIMSFHEFHCALPGYRLKIIGNKQDEQYVESLQLVVDKLWLQNEVDFLWSLSDDERNEVVRKSKACLVPSFKEWFWLVVLEANAMWTAVIGYNVPWLKDSIKEWINGNLVEDGNYWLMWFKLIQMLWEPEMYLKYINKSLEYVKSLPWWTQQTHKLEEVILEVLNNHKKNLPNHVSFRLTK